MLVMFLSISCSKNSQLDFNEVQELAGELNQNITLSNNVLQRDLPDYIISDQIQVNADLQIDAGVRIEFAFGGSLIINEKGSIRATGEKDAPIVLDAKEEKQGYWKGIYIKSMNVMNELSFVEIKNAGGDPQLEDGIVAALNCEAGRIALKNVEISDTEGFGLSLDAKSDLDVHEAVRYNSNTEGNIIMHIDIDNVSILDKASVYDGNNGSDNNITITGGVSHNAVKIKSLPGDVQYQIKDEISFEQSVVIEAGTTLIMEPETRLYFEQSASIQVQGEVDNPVSLIGSIADLPSWKGIVINSATVVNEINYMNVYNAGSNKIDQNWLGDAIAVIALRNNARLRLTNTLIEDYNGCKVFLRSSAQLDFDESISAGDICQ